MDRFGLYLDLLSKWQPRINLVATSTLELAWQRHILDSGQLAAYLPPAPKLILDVGSGAGFPGLVLAIMTGHRVELVESDQRKAVFLSTVIRELGLDAAVHNCRIESLPPLYPDVITARALAALPKLLNLIEKQLHEGCSCLFLKGASINEELTQIESCSSMTASIHPSLSGADGVVLQLLPTR
jgi:16S rRNA (guanine527-N7)-methyltransferase